MGQAVYWLFGLRPHSALHRINFDLAHGECLGIWGNNGMGKATLLNALQGHLQAWSGQIMLNGKDITRLPAHLRARAGLGLVPQGRQIFPNLTPRNGARQAVQSRFKGKTTADYSIDALMADLAL